MELAATFGTATPLVGMVHLPPLPGSPGYAGDRGALRGRALADAQTLVEEGVDAVLVENFGDAPYYPADVPSHVVAELTAVAREVGLAVDAPLGVNVLRNDAAAAVSVAAAAGGSFVRVNVHTGVRATDQGLLEGAAHETLRLRDRLDADVAILADVAVKHSGAVADRPLAQAVTETVERGKADGLVVTGPETGTAATSDHLDAVLDARDDHVPEVPVFVGSGVTPATVADLLDRADGAIVGTSLKADGVTTNPVDADRVAALVAAAPEH
jgi:hypothetical protein